MAEKIQKYHIILSQKQELQIQKKFNHDMIINATMVYTSILTVSKGQVN